MTAALRMTGASISYQEASEPPCLSGVIEATGHDGFSESLLRFLAGLVGANHCAIYQGSQNDLTEVASAGYPEAVETKPDVTLYEVRRLLSRVSSVKILLDVSDVAGSSDGLSQRQRILICAQRGNSSYCLRILRTTFHEHLAQATIEDLRQIADVLLSLVAKHVALCVHKPSVAPILNSLEEIEKSLFSASELSRREGEVCARILYGLSSCGIALDLGIGKESVMTYRKRAYQRLGIGSQRELLMWYLNLRPQRCHVSSEAMALAS